MKMQFPFRGKCKLCMECRKMHSINFINTINYFRFFGRNGGSIQEMEDLYVS